MAADFGEIVLAAIVPDRRDLLLHALQHLEEDHFRRLEHRNIFHVLGRYYEMGGDVPSVESFEALLEQGGTDTSKQIFYAEVFKDLAQRQVPDHEYRFAVEALKEQRAHQLTGEVLATGWEILDRGVEIDRVELKGHRSAREYLYAELARIDRLGLAESAPEGDIRLEANTIREDYAQRKSGEAGRGVFSGIDAIDDTTAGFQRGELIFLCAYTGEGKSMMATQIAWHAAVLEGKNVFFATSETVRAQVRRRLVARHSRLERFGGVGIDSSDLKKGSLSEDNERVFDEVIEDLSSNPAYGRIYVVQVPRGATLGYIEARMARQGAQWNIDLVVIDYLALLRAERKRQSTQEEYNELIKDCKTLATSFQSGVGVPIISPWAVNQRRWLEALQSGEYSLASLAETSEAEKSADIILSMLRLPEEPNKVRMTFLKNRDGDKPPPFELEVDYRNTYLGRPKNLMAAADLLEMA